MDDANPQQWLAWAKQIKAISQIGKTYGKDPYDLDRYDQLAAVAHAMLARLADAPVARVENFFVPDAGYMTPKIDLRGGAFRDGKILMVREKLDGLWSLPGGWADVNESPRQGVEREVFEETGFAVAASRLVAVRDRSLHGYTPQYPDHLFKLFFVCTLADAEAADIGANIEIDAVDFFALDALPPLSLSRVLGADVELLAAHHADPSLPVYCD